MNVNTPKVFIEQNVQYSYVRSSAFDSSLNETCNKFGTLLLRGNYYLTLIEALFITLNKRLPFQYEPTFHASGKEFSINSSKAVFSCHFCEKKYYYSNTSFCKTDQRYILNNLMAKFHSKQKVLKLCVGSK